jgi:hypothetical protein
MQRPSKGSLGTDCCAVNSCKVMLLAACRHEARHGSATGCGAPGGSGSRR